MFESSFGLQTFKQSPSLNYFTIFFVTSCCTSWHHLLCHSPKEPFGHFIVPLPIEQN